MYISEAGVGKFEWCFKFRAAARQTRNLTAERASRDSKHDYTLDPFHTTLADHIQFIDAWNVMAALSS